MWPREIWQKPLWCLYDNTSGTIILKHPFGNIGAVPCPRCLKPLVVEKYRASCCGFNFRTGFHEISQIEPFGTHEKKSGRGWETLRPVGVIPSLDRGGPS
jgi:hypothetical protein